MGKRIKRIQKTTSLFDLAALVNLGGQAVEPFIPAIMAAMKGNWPEAMTLAKGASKEAGGWTNLGQAFAPIVGVSVAKKILRKLGAPNIRALGLRIW